MGSGLGNDEENQRGEQCHAGEDHRALYSVGSSLAYDQLRPDQDDKREESPLVRTHHPRGPGLHHVSSFGRTTFLGTHR